MSWDIIEKFNAFLEYMVVYQGQIVCVSLYEKFLFIVILIAIVFCVSFVVFYLTNITLTVLLPGTVIAMPLL